ncbi:MAG: hypothetical protein R3344_04760 [Acidobacteriota bacterium]|nr:hypothetical protein [Acidobacteriota bacterium]
MAGKQLLVSFAHDNRACWFTRKDAARALDAGTARPLADHEHAALNKGDRDMQFPDKPEKPAAKPAAKKKAS